MSDVPPPPVAAEVRGEQPPRIQVEVRGDDRPEARADVAPRVTRAEARRLPGAFGDPFRAVESLPGVTPIASGLPYFYLRGSPPANVGYLLDGVPVPVLFHVAAGPSVIHPGLVERVDVYAGVAPSEFGRFAGGYVVGTTRDPSLTPRVEAEARAFDASALVETPFTDGRASALAAGRVSYAQPLLALFAPDLSLQYWDYQARAAVRVGARDELRVLGFGARDRLTDTDDFGGPEPLVDSEFHRVDLRYRHRGERTSWSAATTLGVDASAQNVRLGNRSLAARSELAHRLGATLTLRVGADGRVERATQRPSNGGGTTLGVLDDIDFASLVPERTLGAAGAFVELGWRAAPQIDVRPGLRADVYADQGVSVPAIEPRIAAVFRLSPLVRTQHELGLAHQAPSFALSVPGVAPSGLDRGLQQTVQASSGVVFTLARRLETGATLFQHAFYDQTDSLGAGRGLGANAARFRTRVDGVARGIEISLRGSLHPRLDALFAYTLSRSERSAGRERFAAGFDRTHVVSAALSIDLGKRFRLGARGVAYSGFPSEEVVYEGRLRGNAGRTTPFYRLDWRFERRWSFGTRGSFGVAIEVLNTTLSKETIDVRCDEIGVCEERRTGPITLPSVGVDVVY